MDIKLKNKRTYIIIFIAALYIMGISLTLISNVMQDKSYITSSYFNSSNFKNQLASLFQNVRQLNTTYKDYSHKTLDDKVDKDQFNNKQGEYRAELENKLQQIENEYKNDIDQAEENKNTDRAKRLIDERDKKLEDAKKEYGKSDEDIKKELASEYDKRYAEIKASVDGENDIKYFIIDNKTNEKYSNMGDVSKEYVENYVKSSALFSVKLPKEISRNDYPLQDINFQFQNEQLEGYFIVPKGLTVSSALYSNMMNYNDVRNKVIIKAIMAILLFALALAIIIYLYKNIEEFFSSISITSSRYKKLPLDLRVIIFLFCTLVIKYYIYLNRNLFLDSFLSLKLIIVPTIISAYMYYFILNVRGGYKLLNNKEELNKLWRECYIHKVIAVVKDSFIFRNTAIKILSIVIATMFLGMAIIAIPDSGAGAFGVIYTFAYMIVVPLYILRKIAYFNKITKGTEEIVAGNFNYAIKEKGKGTLYKLAHNINNMKVGVEKSINAQMKSERLKSELITNVSHDLKTPLTSIINYIDLLKDEDISKEEMDSYIEILDRKSQRLKVLIEDLFEASKVASGAVEFNKEKVDVVSLLRQAMGEFDEKIKDSGLTFKVNIPTHNVYLYLDGKKTWRVFENLISNILKYSQPNTRVYIDLLEDDAKVKITMKNISAYEMEFDVEEIFERFKRGDKSRNTEGSGLGLAIAKSIVDLQGGSLNIDIDGDLFKVTVEFNK